VTTRDVIAGDRHLTLDDVGDPAGVPVLYLHGTPDSRLSRHPDDGLATTAGVRLLALDRPGYGGSDPLPPGTADGWPAVVAADAAAVLDTLGIERCGLLAWSGGALAGVALAALMPERVSALAIVAGLVPRQAYDDPEVRAAGADRLDTIELADSLPPGTLGEAIAPLLAPYPCDRALAAEHQAEQRDAAGAADVEAQARPMPLNLAAMRAPVRLVYGSADTVTPPAFGRWYAENLPGASLDVVDGAAHYVALTAWGRILATFT
jgi:pimeloyl-ACP methyl ester carboxylesterase